MSKGEQSVGAGVGEQGNAGRSDEEEEEKKAPSTMALLDFYPVNPPFGYAAVQLVDGRRSLRYVVLEPSMNAEEQEMLERLKQILREEAEIPLDALKSSEDMEKYLALRAKRAIKDFKIKIPEESVDKFLYYLGRDFFRYGSIDIPMHDPNIEDISCDGIDIPIYVWHRNYESIASNLSFTSKRELDSFITRLAHKAGHQITISQPIMEGTLPEGFRVHLTLDEVSKRGHTFTLRKHRAEPYTITDLIKLGTISTHMAAYFWILIENARSVMVCGPTASGKTTLLNSISMFIRPETKIVTIEETREIRLQHENWIPMVTRQSFQPGVQEVTLYDLLKSSLRQRPDYIIVGEIRGEEAYTFFQSIAVGHGGICTLHAESADTAVKRLLTRPLDIPLMLIPFMNVIVLTRRMKIEDTVGRRAQVVSEIAGVEEATRKVMFNKVYDWNPLDDTFHFTGKSLMLDRIAEMRYTTTAELMEELSRRRDILEWMAKKDIRRYQDVAEITSRYYLNPDEVLSRARLGME